MQEEKREGDKLLAVAGVVYSPLGCRWLLIGVVV